MAFVIANSANLPKIIPPMIVDFIQSSGDNIQSEQRHWKMERASKAGYGDDSVGRVEVCRENGVATVRADVCPEHRVVNNMYKVTAIVDEGMFL